MTVTTHVPVELYLRTACLPRIAFHLQETVDLVSLRGLAPGALALQLPVSVALAQAALAGGPFQGVFFGEPLDRSELGYPRGEGLACWRA